MADHTPTPWHLGSTETTELVMAFRNNIECVIAELFGEIDITDAENEADAAFIVKAVNSHEALVKALTDTLCELTACANQLADRGVFIHEGNSVSRAQIAARRVLASIKEAV